MPLHAKSKEFLHQFTASGMPALRSQSVPETREAFAGIAAFGGPVKRRPWEGLSV